MKWAYALLLCTLVVGCAQYNMPEQGEKIEMPKKEMKEWRFVPIGDSYTKGEGTATENSWPSVLVRHLKEEGVNITLITNPAQNGWTTLEALELEVPEFKMGRPNIATLMIGANDVVQRVPLGIFEERYSLLLDSMIDTLPDGKNIVIITIPDFSITPVGKAYTGEENIEEEIKLYNSIILKEAKRRNLTVIDLFEPSRSMEHDPSLISEDGLHPSAKGYLQWEKVIYPAVKEKLK